MKRIATVLILAIGLIGCTTNKPFVAGALSSIGPQWLVIDRVTELSNNGSYEAIYEMLSTEYKSAVPKDLFVEKSEQLSWRIAKIKKGRLDIRSNFAWMPIRGSIRNKTGPQVIDFDTVAFFSKEGDDWKLITFPFLGQHYVPESGPSIKWVEKAMQTYEKKEMSNRVARGINSPRSHTTGHTGP